MKIILLILCCLSMFYWFFIDSVGFVGEVGTALVLKHTPSLPENLPPFEEGTYKRKVLNGEIPEWVLKEKYTELAYYSGFYDLLGGIGFLILDWFMRFLIPFVSAVYFIRGWHR